VPGSSGGPELSVLWELCVAPKWQTRRSSPDASPPFQLPLPPPKCPHISFTLGQLGGQRAGNWKRNRIRIQEPRTRLSQTFSQFTAVGRPKMATGQHLRYIRISLRMIPHSDFYFLVCFFLVIWLGGAARWGACWLKQKLYFQGVLLHIAGCLNFLVFL